jgi:hypothetical protein
MHRPKYPAKVPRRVFARRALAGGLALTALSLVWPGSPPARAGETGPAFFIVINAQNPRASIDRRLLADVFLKRVRHWEDGRGVLPADQRADSATRRAFTELVLKRSVAAVRSYWQQRIFSGRDVPPPELDSDAAVFAFVARYDGAIGYVSAPHPPAGVKVIPFVP